LADGYECASAVENWRRCGALTITVASRSTASPFCDQHAELPSTLELYFQKADLRNVIRRERGERIQKNSERIAMKPDGLKISYVAKTMYLSKLQWASSKGGKGP
jgi:hypothetical protein